MSVLSSLAPVNISSQLIHKFRLTRSSCYDLLVPLLLHSLSRYRVSACGVWAVESSRCTYSCAANDPFSACTIIQRIEILAAPETDPQKAIPSPCSARAIPTCFPGPVPLLDIFVLYGVLNTPPPITSRVSSQGPETNVANNSDTSPQV